MGTIYHANGIFYMNDNPAAEVAIVAHGAWYRKDVPNIYPSPANTTVLFYAKHMDFAISAERHFKNGDLGPGIFPVIQGEMREIQLQATCDGPMNERHTKEFPTRVEQSMRAKTARWT